MQLASDIDIDLPDRDILLKHISATPASMYKNNVFVKHNTGVYITDVPLNSLQGICGIDYIEAEKRGYFKLDLLNVHVYQNVRDEKHLSYLMRDPDWSLLKNRDFFEKVIHIGNHYDSAKRMPEWIDNISKLAMFMAIIRPAKRHLIGKPWSEVEKTIWEKSDDEYTFKRSHSYGYAMLAIVHMNLLIEQGEDDAL